MIVCLYLKRDPITTCKPGTWNLESGTWNLKPGTWNLEPGTWNLEPGTWNLEPGTILKLLPDCKMELALVCVGSSGDRIKTPAPVNTKQSEHWQKCSHSHAS